MNKNDGMNYAPVGKPQPVVHEGEFIFAAAALDHGHIYGMSNGLIEAGATLKWVYDPDPAKVDKFIQQYPQARVADSLDVILADEIGRASCREREYMSAGHVAVIGRQEQRR